MIDRLKSVLVAIVEELLPNRAFYAPVRYTVTKAEGGKFSAKPTSNRYPTIKDAPTFAIFGGNAESKLTVGSVVLVTFPEGNPSDPVLLAVLDAPVTIDLECSGDVHVDPGGLVKVATAADFVALAAKVDQGFADLVTFLTTLAANIAAHVHPAPGTAPPTNAALFLPPNPVASTAATKLKTD